MFKYFGDYTIFLRFNLDGTSEFFTGTVSTESGSALIFVSKPLLPAFSETKHVFVDGTFRTVPTMFHQLLTVHFTAYNEVSIVNKLITLSCVFNCFFLDFPHCLRLNDQSETIAVRKGVRLCDSISRRICRSKAEPGACHVGLRNGPAQRHVIQVSRCPRQRMLVPLCPGTEWVLLSCSAHFYSTNHGLIFFRPSSDMQ